MTVSPTAVPASPFAALGLHDQIVRALIASGYETPTPIQARTIPLLLEGRDLLGIAQTGTGKTAAFALPILHYLHTHPRRVEPRKPRALILAPTRELASQILEACRKYGTYLPLRHDVVYGGVGMGLQVKTLQKGLDILIATPGRLLDLMQQRHVDLSRVEVLVLDEADRMLDMGFIRDVERVLKTLPKQRQSLLFSATMPDDVARLARGHLHQPERVEVTPPAATTELVEQSVCFVEQSNKREVLTHLLRDPQFSRTLVFTRTKHGADRVAKQLVTAGIEAKAIHGDKSQGQRERALQSFRDGQTPVLVATDLAARGIDVPEVTHVVNFDLPNIPESYVHRIGRTARAGREGIAISLCSGEEREYLRDIEKLIRKRVPVVKLEMGKTTVLKPVAAAPGDGEPRPHRGGRGDRPDRPLPARREPQPAPAQRVDWTEIARTIGAEPADDAEPRPQGHPMQRPQPAKQPQRPQPSGGKQRPAGNGTPQRGETGRRDGGGGARRSGGGGGGGRGSGGGGRGSGGRGAPGGGGGGGSGRPQRSSGGGTAGGRGGPRRRRSGG